MSKIMSIDFGTSSGMIGFMESPDSPVQFPHLTGELAHGIPTLFMCDNNGKEYVCDQVTDINGLVEDPQGVCQSVKMKLKEKEIRLNGRSFTPREIMVKEIRRMIEVCRQCFASIFIDLDYDVVSVAVPDDFNAAEKGEYKSIFQEATGCQNVCLVDEASAAAKASLHVKHHTGRPVRGILVPDAGAGTTDVVYLEPDGETHHPRGIREAGDAVDAAMADLVMEKLRRNPGSLNLDLFRDQNYFAYRRLLTQCRVAKEHLSRTDSYTLEITDYSGGYSRITIRRSEFETAIRPLLQKMVDLAEAVLNACNLGHQPDIDILMVGGTSCIPLLQEMMRSKFHWVNPACFKPCLPDKAVAMGAALYAAHTDHLITKTSYGYAIAIVGENYGKNRLQVVIPHNAKMPCTVTSGFATAFDNQTCCRLCVYEISHGFTDQILELEEGNPTDYVMFHEFPHAVPLHTNISVTATLTKDGILTLTSRDQIPGGKVCRKSFSLSNMEVTENGASEMEDDAETRRRIHDLFNNSNL